MPVKNETTSTYPKAWIKFEQRLKAHSTKELATWNAVDFLGYFSSQCGMEIAPAQPMIGYRITTAPSRHPQVRNMERLIARLHNTAGYVPALDTWDRQLIKDYLDFQIARTQRHQVESVAYVSGSEALTAWQNRATAAEPQRQSYKKTYRPGATDAICRTTPLPEGFSRVWESSQAAGHRAATYGDLAWHHQIGEVLIPWGDLDQFGITPETLEKVI